MAKYNDVMDILGRFLLSEFNGLNGWGRIPVWWLRDGDFQGG